MRSLARVVVIGVLFGLAGCPKETPPPADLTVTATPTEILADGTNTIDVTVTGAAVGVTVSVKAGKGSWKGSTKSTQDLDASGAATLVTCDSRVDTACAGSVRITATGSDGAIGVATVKFLPGENCKNGADDDADGKTDCADETCLDQPCTLAGNAGTGTCTAAGACECSLGAAEICSDGQDNNCDGKIDCAETTCSGKLCTLPSGVAGACASSACVCPNKAEVCNDPIDEDCDGLVNCADTDCQPVGNNPGKVCDGLGHTCSPVVGGASTCTICSGNGKAAEDKETLCGDGADNDCDGLVDCQDPDCADKVCSATGGKTCNGTTLLCACPFNEVTETSCNDLQDNDCDGKIDCADEDCPAGADCKATATSVGMKCNSSKACVCTGNGGTPETAESKCGDGFDNDCDGLVDCADSDCAKKSCGTGGKICGEITMLCECPAGQVDQNGTCVCGSGTAEVCDDGADNNCDGLIDCLDTTCNGKICNKVGGGKGMCANKVCACPGKSADICNNGVDDDCDNLVDCDDPDCQPVGNNLGKVCDDKGNTCSPVINGVSTCTVCGGGGGTRQTVESLCGDGFDNDCDGKMDCLDPDCAGLRCTATGKLCTGATFTCDCPDLGAEVDADCSDLADNDCDGLVDCADSDCTAGTPCRLADKPSYGTKCDAAKKCVCSGNGGTVEAKEATCNDGKDNDCDNAVDCADTDCQPTSPTASDGKLCSTAALGKKCNAVGECACPLGQSAESTCDDSLDNDCDGLKDCADSNCDGLTCSSTGKKCASGQCTCPSGLTSETTCGDNLDNDCDGLTDCADPDCNGLVCSSYSANYKCTGTPSVCKDVTTTFSLVLTASATRIPANGTATSTITATLKDGTTPLPNQTVTFAVSGPGAVGSAPLTNSSGVTTVTYTAGTGVGPAVITATYNTGTQDITGRVSIDTPRVGQVKVVSQQYSIMGVKYSSYQESNLLTFQVLDLDNLTYPAGLTVAFTHAPASGSSFSTGSCTTSLCTTTGVTDSKGTVSVTLNSGTAASVVSVQADATAGDGTGSATAGNIAIVGAKTSGSHISLVCSPYNVPGFNDHDCTNSKVNSTITCTASFADRFNNVLGVPTIATLSTEAGAAGPPSSTDKTGVAKNFVAVQNFRLPVDVAPLTGEHNLEYDSGCGLKVHNPRDGLATIIVSATGEEGFVDGSNGHPANGVYDLGENFIDIGEPFVDADDDGVQSANEYYIDVNNNGKWDGPNGVWDSSTVIWAETRVLYTGYSAVVIDSGWYELSRFFELSATPPLQNTAAPFFAVLSGKTTGGNATSQSFGVYFADQNFNVPVASTVYAVKTVAGSVTAKFTTDPKSPDTLGMLFTQQFCDAAGANCYNDCRQAPCFVKTSVSSFGLGTYGVVQITGGGNPDLGLDEVRATSTHAGIETSVSIQGYSD